MKLPEVVNAERLRSLLDEHAPVEDIVLELFKTGEELSHVVTFGSYDKFEDFVEAHKAGMSELIDLEGPASINDDLVVVLKSCPMAAEMAKLNVEGKPPVFFPTICNSYMEQNPGSNAILHPGCIAHQVARQLIVRDIKIGQENSLNFFQLACRNMATGKVVYDENGLKRVGMGKEKAAKLIDGFACLYAIVRTK